MAKHALCPGKAKSPEDLCVVLPLDCPGSAEDDARRGVDHGELDCVESCDAVEERRPVGRGLRKDSRDAYRTGHGCVSPEKILGLLPATASGLGPAHPTSGDVNGQGRIERERAVS